ncbi:DUF4148 domain-containing protein [Paraburkholderia sp. BL21I4N1]|uniref:DUF4148 domain-containing protein n=1 Tax=Paraburkholderia sp. BL21I4N1 TaxID=1938801 RepID=UPI000CFCE10A|nr:DUF4148 domain-containing protein [Paraburkholderia sp. BL21I4N1]PQV49305.1 uncharacterized protein DUF4148 [Paraburkholderia sp. BL21I4N1]
MHGEPRKVVLSGLVVGALAIAAYVSPSGRHWLSADEPGVGSADESAPHARGDIMSGAITSGPVMARAASDTALSNGLQAARSSLQRNDLAAAQAQLDAVAATHKNDGQLAALQREVQTRAQASQQARVETQEAPKATRTSPSLPAKGHRSRDRHYAARDYSGRASGDASRRRGVETQVSNAAGDRMAGSSVLLDESTVMTSRARGMPPTIRVGQGLSSAPAVPPLILQTPPGASVEQASPSNRQTELTAQAPSQPTSLQPTAPGGTLLKSDGPKTRAQVREEIVRARSNGSLPAFGNPDPAGPGGAPSLVNAQRP